MDYKPAEQGLYMNRYRYAYERKGYGEHSCFNQINPMQKHKASTQKQKTNNMYRSTQNPMPKRIVGLKWTQSSKYKVGRSQLVYGP
jgi:hypothetical protein